MKSTFQKLYCLSNEYVRKNTDFESFVFVWKNWDHYFREKVSKHCELLENVELTHHFEEKKFIDRDSENLHGLYLQYA